MVKKLNEKRNEENERNIQEMNKMAEERRRIQ